MLASTRASSRIRLPALLVGLSLTLAVGCGDQNSPVVNSNADQDVTTPMDLGDEYIAQKTNVIMPWTHELSGETVDQIQIEADRLVFPAGTPAAEQAAEFDRGDVVVSADPEQPFLRKIESVEEADGALVFHTRNAQLTEAVYKGQLTQQPASQAPTDAEGVRRQRLGAEEAPRISSGDITIDASVSKTIANGSVSGDEIGFTANTGTTFSAKPSVTINASVYMDMEIEPGSGMDVSHETFTGTKTCYTQDDCFPDAARGENRGVSCQSNLCTYESTEYDGFWFDAAGPSCNDIIAALDFAAQNPSCDADFNSYYDGNMTLSQVKAGPCGDYLPPHPVQVDWAKDNCSGALRRMVFDAEGSLTPTTGPLKMQFKASGSKSWTLWETRDKRLMSKLFFIGWFPVYITANGKASLTATVSASVDGSVELNPITLNGLRYGTGFHYYADSSEDQNLGVRMNDGSIAPFYDGTTGDFAANPERTPQPQWEGLNFEEQDLTAKVNGEITASIGFAPRVDLLLYDVAGPFVEPFTPYADLKFSAGGVFSTQSGSSGTAMCSEDPANLCGRIGVKAKVGLTAANICGSKCEWDTELYDTCSDYCPNNDELPLCYKMCVGGQGPKPLEVELQWESDAVDLDLAMLDPQYIDYQDDSYTTTGYRHEGDECPAAFAGCTGVQENGKFTETITMSDESSGPASGTQMRFEVETFKATGQGSFDLIIKQEGQVVKEWTGQSSGQRGDKQEFSFTIP